MFPHALGKYVKSKNFPLLIQQMVVTRVSNEEVDLYNRVYIDYMKNKRLLGSLDDRIQAFTTS